MATITRWSLLALLTVLFATASVVWLLYGQVQGDKLLPPTLALCLSVAVTLVANARVLHLRKQHNGE